MTDQARCPVCGRAVDPADTACRYCGAGLPTAPTIATPPDAPPAPAPGAAEVLAQELREALAPAIQLLRPLGEGGMGHVWLGRDPALKRLVAVKVLHPELANDPTSRARFAREAEAAAAVAHPGVVSVYQVGELPRSGTAYFVMQYVEGKSLQDEIKPGEAMPEPRARRIVGEVASALAAAHARGLVHRDIKPANVMIDGESGRVVVLDFGISAALERRATPGATRLTAEGHSIGTPMYMSPEQAAAGDVTPKSDVYSLGIVAFELATGRPPFTGSTSMELVAAHIKDVPPKVSSLRPDFDPQFAELIDRCLEKNPAKRPTAADIARAILPTAQPLIEWPPPGLEPLRGRGASLLATLSVVVGVGLFFLTMVVKQPILISPESLNLRLTLVRGAPRLGLAFDGTPIWFFVLAFCLLLMLAFVPIVAARAWRLAALLSWARRGGYPWPSLVDVAWDYRADTGALLNGVGRFALVPPAERDRLRRLRRVQAMVAGATLLAAVVATLLWLTGLTGGWADSSEILPSAEAAVLFAPVILGMLGFVWLGQPEARVGVRAQRASPFPWRRKEPALRPELVGAWLGSAGLPAPRKSRRGAKLALALVPTVLVLGLAVAAAVVLVTAFVAAQLTAKVRSPGLAVVQSLSVDSLMRWQEYDSLFAAAARLPEPGATLDLESARRLVGWTLRHGPVASYWDVDTTGRPDSLPMSTYGLTYRRAVQQLPGRLTSGLADTLSRDTMTPMLPVWRRVARSAPLPPLWYLRAGLPGIENPLQLPLLPYMATKDAAFHNASAGLLALNARDSVTALRHARENIAVGRQLMRSPRPSEHILGQVVAGSGFGLLEQTGRVMNDPALVAERDRLLASIRRVRSELAPWWNGTMLLMADPAQPIGVRYLADTTLMPWVRSTMAEAAVGAFCLSAREILFGVDARRRAVLDSAGTALRDLPRMDDLLALQRRALDEWITSPSHALAGYARATGLDDRSIPSFLRPLGWIGFRGVRDRLAFCSSWLVVRPWQP